MNQTSLLKNLNESLTSVASDPQGTRLIAEKAMSWSQRNGWLDTLALANLVLAKVFSAQSLYTKSIEHCQRAKTLFKDLGSATQTAECYSELGRTYYYIAEYSLAIDHLRDALTWLQDQQDSQSLLIIVRMRLAQSLMNIGYWSEAEQELTTVNQFDCSNHLLSAYHIVKLRLAFHHSDQRAIKKQLKLCRELVYDHNNPKMLQTMDYYNARFIVKYGKLKLGEKQLLTLWRKKDKTDLSIFFLVFETALDILQSEFPQKGIEWLSTLLGESELPLSLKQRVHLSLADFYMDHLSYELATQHYRTANQTNLEMRDNEVRLQWARFKANEDHQTLKKQITQQKQNNQILAESNALLQVVNRIALSVNSAPDLESLIQRLHNQLTGWIDAETIAISELKENNLHYNVILQNKRFLPKQIISMAEEEAWSVRSIQERRIMYNNNYSLTDESQPNNDILNLMRSIAFVPLLWENKMLGVMTLQSKEEQAFDPRSISLLEYIKPVIGIAFANMLNLQYARDLSNELNKQQQKLSDVKLLMEHMSEHDELTGLLNRSALPNEFDRWTANKEFHCIMLEIQNLDSAISEIGFRLGDQFIKEMARQLISIVGSEDTLIRNSENQFMIFLKESLEYKALEALILEMLESIRLPWHINEKEIQVKACAGAISYPEHGQNLEEIMSMLSIALGHAKEYDTHIFIVD